MRNMKNNKTAIAIIETKFLNKIKIFIFKSAYQN